LEVNKKKLGQGKEEEEEEEESENFHPSA